MGIVKNLNNIVNKVMKVADPVGGFLKEKTEKGSQKDLAKMLGLTPPSAIPGEADNRRMDADESTVEKKDEKDTIAARQRRQGSGPGSTLLTNSDDESQRLSKSTLLGL
jgi:RNA 3'-terminal phosphate cyclase